MERYDLRGLIIDALRARKVALNERSDPARFNCVVTTHSSPGSAWIGDGAWGCHACGTNGQPLATLARHLSIEVPKSGFTVEEYAERKQFSLSRLAEWGVKTTDGKYGPVVAIPYRGQDGVLLRTKLRSRGGVGKPATWWHNDGSGTFLYGLDRLAKYPNVPVICVEGESDCHAAWHHDVLAIGVPGAGNWKSDWAPLLANREVYVWQEPGEAGEKMVRSIARDLPNARVIDNGGVKDLADLHIDLGAGFTEAMKARMASAYPIGRVPPTVFDALVGATWDRLKAKKLAPIDAVPTMIPSWNRECRDAGGGVGLARGWHDTVAAKSGFGKTVIALNLGVEAVLRGERVAFISLEMSQEQIATRFLAITSGVPIRKLEQGRTFDARSWSSATRIVNDLYDKTGGCFHVNRTRISKLDEIVASMRYEHEVHGCRFMVVDYIQLAKVTATGQRDGDLLSHITEISAAVRGTAGDLNVVSVALSQFNRTTSANLNVAPTPEGLMGGSPIENDSDQVVLLDHSSHERTRDCAITKLLLAKNRHGALKDIPVRLDFRTLRLTELTQARIPVGDDAHDPDDRSEYAEVGALATDDGGQMHVTL